MMGEGFAAVIPIEEQMLHLISGIVIMYFQQNMLSDLLLKMS
jgi:hypothetical protein